MQDNLTDFPSDYSTQFLFLCDEKRSLSAPGKLADNTIDERILSALRGKDVTQSELIDAVKADLGEVC